MSRSELSQGHSRECVGRRLLSRGKLLEKVAKDFEILTSLITKVGPDIILYNLGVRESEHTEEQSVTPTRVNFWKALFGNYEPEFT